MWREMLADPSISNTSIILIAVSLTLGKVPTPECDYLAKASSSQSLQGRLQQLVCVTQGSRVLISEFS